MTLDPARRNGSGTPMEQGAARRSEPAATLERSSARTDTRPREDVDGSGCGAFGGGGWVGGGAEVRQSMSGVRQDRASDALWLPSGTLCPGTESNCWCGDFQNHRSLARLNATFARRACSWFGLVIRRASVIASSCRVWSCSRTAFLYRLITGSMLSL